MLSSVLFVQCLTAMNIWEECFRDLPVYQYKKPLAARLMEVYMIHVHSTDSDQLNELGDILNSTETIYTSSL